MLMMYRHGLRVSEVTALRRDDANLSQARLWVRRLKPRGSLMRERFAKKQFAPVGLAKAIALDVRAAQVVPLGRPRPSTLLGSGNQDEVRAFPGGGDGRAREAVEQRRLAVVRRLKNGLSVEHPIPGDELRFIRRHLANRTDRLPWPFLSERGQPLSRKTVYYLVSTAECRTSTRAATILLTRVRICAPCRTISATAIRATPCITRASLGGDLMGCGGDVGWLGFGALPLQLRRRAPRWRRRNPRGVPPCAPCMPSRLRIRALHWRQHWIDSEIAMSQHPALSSQVVLERTFVARTAIQRDVIATVGEALRFLVKVPAEFDGLHWALASTSLCFAQSDPIAGTHIATRAFANALATDGFLRNELPRAPSSA
jgi:hypothetical protein